MVDCCGGQSLNPEIQEAVDDVQDKIDSYTSSLLSSLVSKLQEQQQQPIHPGDVSFPAPFADENTGGGETVPVHCNAEDKHIYSIPRVDDYFGDVGFFDDVCFYGKFSDGMFGSAFNEKEEPLFKDEWDEVSKSKDTITGARHFFSGLIGSPVYGIGNVQSMQNDKMDAKDGGNEVLQTKQLNDWEMVTVDNIRQNKNQILTQLLGDGIDGDESDLWIKLIAFSGYGAHRTKPRQKDGKHGDAYFVNDVTFLDQYEVRPGYKRYGAAAFFDQKFQLTEIRVSHTGRTYMPPPKDGDGLEVGGSTKAEWLHAKWCWKVSVSVATFLVDHLAHHQLRETSGLIKALRVLPENHELRRLMMPFTFGAVQRGRAMNEYLRRYGLYHRAFAFMYGELQRLIKDSMSDAPEKGVRSAEDAMKYRFRLFKKKVNVMRKLPDEIYPIYTDSWDYWVQTMHFVTMYLKPYYGEDDKDDSRLVSKQELEIRKFYDILLANLQIDEVFRLKKFNVINLLAHFICSATIWNHHLNSAVSFVYSVDPDFTGLKILGNNARQSNVQNHAEYCCVAMSKGWNDSDLMRFDRNGSSIWNHILDGQRESSLPHAAAPERNKAALTEFFNKMKTMEKTIHNRNLRRIAPYNAMNPKFLPASARL